MKSQKDKYETDKNIELTKFNGEKYNFESAYIQKREKVIKNFDIWFKNNRSEMFNNFLGSQTVSMVYNADIEEFAVSVESQHKIIFKFNIFVPQFVAQEFKNSVKNFRFSFVKQADKFILENINVLFQDKEFFAKDFDKNIFIEIEKQRVRELRIQKVKDFVVAIKDFIVERPKTSILISIILLTLIYFNIYIPIKYQYFVGTTNSFTAGQFTIRSSTFIDNKNGYMWEKPKKDEMNWYNAKSYCENLNLDGYSDWKLPSRDELHTLMTAYYGKYDSNRDTWFNNNEHKRNDGLFLPKEISGMFVKVGSWYWSSSINETYSSYSWIVGFNSGDGNWNGQADDYFVVCVRDL